MSDSLESLPEPLARAARYARELDYAGPDPYSALSAEPLKRLPGRLSRRLATQLVKRGPTFVHRRLTLRMSKTLGLFALAYGYMPSYRAEQVPLLDELRMRALSTGTAWGYEFDVEVRWDGYRAGEANVPASAPAVEAFTEASRLDEGLSGQLRRWVEDDLIRGGGFCRYVRTADSLIHNGNLLGLRIGLRAGVKTNLLRRALFTTLRAQAPDGSWPYGDVPSVQWNDSFHTVNILECLVDLLPIAPEAHEHLVRGTHHWISKYFSKDGLVQYFPDRPGPIDIHNIATSVFGLSKLASYDNNCKELLETNVKYLLSFQLPDGSFRRSPRRPAFMRWNQAHAFHALAYVASQRARMRD